jgi:hypothetical protein
VEVVDVVVVDEVDEVDDVEVVLSPPGSVVVVPGSTLHATINDRHNMAIPDNEPIFDFFHKTPLLKI